MAYHVNAYGRVVRTADNATLPIDWSDGAPAYGDEASDDSRAFAAWLAAGNGPAPYAPTAAEANAPILARIAALEARQARPIREHALGVAGAKARVQAIDDDIAVLRAQIRE